MASLESIYSCRGSPKEGVGTLSITSSDDGGCTRKTYGKTGYECGMLGDLSKLGTNLEILNLLRRNQVVRNIMVSCDTVAIDAMDGSGYHHFPADTIVYYEPWEMDRGNYVFWSDEFGAYLKLATEGDPVRVMK
jgi:hypothetical protein